MASRPTKVISLRIPLHTLGGCYDLLQKGGMDPTKMGYSLVVRTVLESFIDSLIEKGQIPNYDIRQLRQKFGIRQIKTVVFPVDDPDVVPAVEESSIGRTSDTGASIRKVDAELGKIQTGNSTAFDLALEVERAILGESDPDIREEVRISDQEVAVSTNPNSLNLYKSVAESDDVLRKKAPGDRFVELLANPEANELVKQAIRVLYNTLPLELWGSKIAESQINLLIQRHSEDL